MSVKTLCKLVRAAIFAVGMCGLSVCICLYPFLVSLDGMAAVSETAMKIQLLFYWITSVPCFVILGIGWKMTASMESEFFTRKNARLFEICALILFFDSIVFAIGNTVFMFLGQNFLAIAFYAIIIVALIISLAFAVMGHYVLKAAVMREENESYI